MLRCGSTLFGLNPPVLGRRGQDCTCAISLLLAFGLQYIICTMMYYWYQIVQGKVVLWFLLLQGGYRNSLPYFSGPVHFVQETQKHWHLEATVQVERSADHTYFMVVGFYPGGYCGIQQKQNNERVAIFSLWNKGSYSVKSVGAGPGVQVSEFGGEGTGIKTMRDCDWKVGTLVTFTVEGYIEGMISYFYVFKH